MCIEYEAYGLGGDLRDRRKDLVGERGELIVHDEDPVLADRQSDVAALSHEHVDAAAQRLGTNLNRVEVLGGEWDGVPEGAKSNDGDGGETAHGVSPAISGKGWRKWGLAGLRAPGLAIPHQGRASVSSMLYIVHSWADHGLLDSSETIGYSPAITGEG